MDDEILNDTFRVDRRQTIGNKMYKACRMFVGNNMRCLVDENSKCLLKENTLF